MAREACNIYRQALHREKSLQTSDLRAHAQASQSVAIRKATAQLETVRGSPSGQRQEGRLPGGGGKDVETGEVGKVEPRIQGPAMPTSFLYLPTFCFPPPAPRGTFSGVNWGEGVVLTHHCFPQFTAPCLSAAFPFEGCREDDSLLHRASSKGFVSTPLKVTSRRCVFLWKSPAFPGSGLECAWPWSRGRNASVCPRCVTLLCFHSIEGGSLWCLSS